MPKVPHDTGGGVRPEEGGAAQATSNAKARMGQRAGGSQEEVIWKGSSFSRPFVSGTLLLHPCEQAAPSLAVPSSVQWLSMVRWPSTQAEGMDAELCFPLTSPGSPHPGKGTVLASLSPSATLPTLRRRSHPPPRVLAGLRALGPEGPKGDWANGVPQGAGDGRSFSSRPVGTPSISSPPWYMGFRNGNSGAQRGKGVFLGSHSSRDTHVGSEPSSYLKPRAKGAWVKGCGLRVTGRSTLQGSVRRHQSHHEDPSRTAC